MALPRPRKNKDDLKFINPETMKVECTYSECYKKFEPQKNTHIMQPKWNSYKPIKHESFYHECSECSRHIASLKDKRDTVGAYMSAIAGNFKEPLTREEQKKADSKEYVLKDVWNIGDKKHWF